MSDPKSNKNLANKIVVLEGDLLSNWDRVAEYSFSVVDAKTNKPLLATDLGLPKGIDPLQTSPFEGAFWKAHGGGEAATVRLIIPPQAINIQTQFATNVIATNNGILEEHNGTVFRMITISGTTGVWPGRAQQTSNSLFKIGKQMFPAAASAISNVVKAGMGLAGAAVGFADSFKNKSSANAINQTDKKSEKGGDPAVKAAEDAYETGHAQFWKLYNFFVAYTEFKKTQKGHVARLIFTSPKDGIDYTVTPLAFDLRRDARNPLLYNYNIVLKAWKVKRAGWSQSNLFSNGVDIRAPSFVRSLIDIVRRVRLTINRSENVLMGVQSDIKDINRMINQAYLIQKDVNDLGYTLFDLKDTLTKDDLFKIYAYNKDQVDAAKKRFSDKADGNKSKSQRTEQSQQAAGTGASDSPSAGLQNTIDELKRNLEDKQSALTKSQEETNIYREQADRAKADIANKTSPTGEGTPDSKGALAAETEKDLDAVVKNPDALEDINTTSLTLPDSVQKAIANLQNEQNGVTAGEVLSAAEKLQELSDNIAAQSGILDPTYSQIYDVPNPESSGKSVTEDDIILQADIQESISSLIALTAATDVYQTLEPSPIKSINEAVAPSEQAPEPTSSYPVTVNRGDTLESIAATYLGDPNRFREIAALNDLASPYIDEIGVIIPISNPSGRTFNVRDNRNLILNQIVNITGNGQAPTRRRVLSIEEVGLSYWKITVDGTMDLDRFAGTQAYLTVTAPKTVAPGDTILIPSQDPPDLSTQARPTSLQDKLTNAEKLFRVDIALDGTNSTSTNTKSIDISIDSSGDVSRSYGYANALQIIRNAIEIERGALSQHPEYGLPNLVGQRSTVASESEIVQAIRRTILADSRFSDVQVAVIKEGSVVYVNVNATGSLGTGRIPVQFRYDL